MAFTSILHKIKTSFLPFDSELHKHRSEAEKSPALKEKERQTTIRRQQCEIQEVLCYFNSMTTYGWSAGYGGRKGEAKKGTTSIFTEPRQANGAKQKNKRKKQGK
jgi:hypothetical protein